MKIKSKLHILNLGMKNMFKEVLSGRPRFCEEIPSCYGGVKSFCSDGAGAVYLLSSLYLQRISCIKTVWKSFGLFYSDEVGDKWCNECCKVKPIFYKLVDICFVHCHSFLLYHQNCTDKFHPKFFLLGYHAYFILL